MIPMKFIKKIPASILGVGHFEPKEGGREYSLPDDVAAGLIATQDPDWEQIKTHENHSNKGATTDKEPAPFKGRK